MLTQHEALKGGVDRHAVVGGQQIEQQSADDGYTQPRLCARRVWAQPEARGVVGGRGDPGIDDVLEQPRGARLTLQGLRVQLEEEALVGPQARVGQPAPHGAHGIRLRDARVAQQLGHERALGVLDRAHDRHQQAFARSEVIDEHAVAGADGGRQLAQAETANAVLGDVGHDRGQEPGAGAGITGHGVVAGLPTSGVPHGTRTTWYRSIFASVRPAMSQFLYSIERVLDAPVAVVYHCLVDYREHHRPGPDGFLPPAFPSLDVLRGGVGAGTVIRFTTTVGGRSVTRTQEVSEPEPGRLLVEQGGGEGSTFTLEPRGDRTLLRIDCTLQARGLEGVLLRVFAPFMLGPILADELKRLERYAQAHPALVAV
jgi:hypothetical protein